MAGCSTAPPTDTRTCCVFAFSANTPVRPGPCSSSTCWPGGSKRGGGDARSRRRVESDGRTRWATRRWTLTPVTSAVCTDALSVFISCANTIFRLVYITQHIHWVSPPPPPICLRCELCVPASKLNAAACSGGRVPIGFFCACLRCGSQLRRATCTILHAAPSGDSEDKRSKANPASERETRRSKSHRFTQRRRRRQRR